MVFLSLPLKKNRCFSPSALTEKFLIISNDFSAQDCWRSSQPTRLVPTFLWNVCRSTVILHASLPHPLLLPSLPLSVISNLQHIPIIFNIANLKGKLYHYVQSSCEPPINVHLFKLRLQCFMVTVYVEGTSEKMKQICFQQENHSCCYL